MTGVEHHFVGRCVSLQLQADFHMSWVKSGSSLQSVSMLHTLIEQQCVLEAEVDEDKNKHAVDNHVLA